MSHRCHACDMVVGHTTDCPVRLNVELADQATEIAELRDDLHIQTDEKLRLRAEVERLKGIVTRSKAWFEDGERVLAPYVAVAKAADRVVQTLDNLYVWTNQLTEFPREEAKALRDAITHPTVQARMKRDKGESSSAP